ncbi:MAG: T9SS type A sorting domain-containing protein [Flavobacteriaceae bacterium]|nr:T9SS type A sorting domain-containing protein [Flavobacteriaceae bacterium]
MKKLFTLLALGILCSFYSQAQTQFPPVSVGEGTFLGESIPLRDMPTAENWDGDPEEAFVVPLTVRLQGRQKTNSLPIGPDPLVQTEPAYRNPANLIIDWEGADLPESGGFIPPDPTGAVGPNHYVHAVNVRVKIFDKVGNLLLGPVSLAAFFGSGNNDGDPIVMYDQLADRFFVSQFRVSDNALIMAVSTTPDPTGSYFVYEYPLSFFPDYPHYTVWPDGYYLTANKGGSTTYAFERDEMLIGGASPGIRGFSLAGAVSAPAHVFSPEPANLLGTDFIEGAPGYIVYLQDDAWGGVSVDHLKVWEISLDWDGASLISQPQEIPLAPFDSQFQAFGVGDIGQPGTGQKIDSQQKIISYMANYRSFPTHNSFVITFNVDIDGADTAGIRWVELRNTGTDPWTLYQEGTWSIADGDSRFCSSSSIDEEGNIGLAYNVGSTSTPAAIRYTGRMEGDPLGTMTFPETTIINGPGVQTFSNRFGDYAQMTMDINNRTFWHTAQYFQTTNSWATRIGAFQLITDKTDDVGVYNFVTPGFAGPYTATEAVEVSIYNYGTDPQSNFDIELLVDGSVVATETYTGTLAANSSDTYAFTATIDLSTSGQVYTVEARTNLAGDEYSDNDEYKRDFSFGEILGIEGNELSENNLLVYPLDDGQYEIMYTTPDNFGDVTYKVYSIVGQTISSGKMLAQSNGYKAAVDMNVASKGVYIFEISNGNNKISKKLLVR